MRKRTGSVVIAVIMVITLLSGCAESNAANQPLTAADYLSLGEKYLLDLDYEQAEVQFKLLIEADPMEPRGYTGLAEAYIGLSSYDEAADTLRDGYSRLADNRAFQRQSVKLYEVLVEKVPADARLYLELAELYKAMGDEERAQDILRRGHERFPDDERFKNLFQSDLIPEYEIKQTLLHETVGDDGVVAARIEYWQPVFIGDGDNVRTMNAAFEAELAGVNLNEFEYVREAYNNKETGIYQEVQDYGVTGGISLYWDEGWRREPYISFYASWYWYGFGVHGSSGMDGCTFDASTGEMLGMTDVFSIPVSEMETVLYNEYVAYHMAGDRGLGELALEYPDSVKSQCGDNATFWLEADGVHLFFGEYTFFYAAGSSELVIPFDRTDLLREPFWAEGAVSTVPSVEASAAPEVVMDVSWKQAYLDTLLEAKSYGDSNDWENHDYNGMYPAYMSGIQIADLNFDGTPELLLFGDGVSASELMRIYTISNGNVVKIFQDWGNPGYVLPYRRSSDNSLAYCFTSGNGSYESYEGEIYIIDSDSVMDDKLAERSKVAEFSELTEYDYNPDTYEETVLGSTYMWNGSEVSYEEYISLHDSVLAGYTLLDYTPASTWIFDIDGSAAAFEAFLDTYQPER